jgi:DNA mismatch repair protein MutS2
VKEFLSNMEARVNAEETELEREGLALAHERVLLEEEASGSKTAVSEKPGKLKPGTEVLAGEFRSRGRVLRKDKKSQGETFWVVEIGSLKMSFPEKNLIPLIQAGNSNSLPKSASWILDHASSAPFQPELRLRGMRLAEAMEALSRQIDAAALGGVREFAVIHGKGDGILSKGVHDFLKKDSRVEDYYFSRPEMGGFGRTEVVLK